jgi:hypothetical protein
MKKIRLLQVVLTLMVIATVACSGVSQKAEPQKPEGSKITVQGRIDYSKSSREYIVVGEIPARTYFVVNQNTQVLEELFKSQKRITIEGYRTSGADFLFIEKIDGKPYTGK